MDARDPDPGWPRPRSFNPSSTAWGSGGHAGALRAHSVATTSGGRAGLLGTWWLEKPSEEQGQDGHGSAHQGDLHGFRESHSFRIPLFPLTWGAPLRGDQQEWGWDQAQQAGWGPWVEV